MVGSVMCIRGSHSGGGAGQCRLSGRDRCRGSNAGGQPGELEAITQPVSGWNRWNRRRAGLNTRPARIAALGWREALRAWRLPRTIQWDRSRWLRFLPQELRCLLGPGLNQGLSIGPRLALASSCERIRRAIPFLPTESFLLRPTKIASESPTRSRLGIG